MTNLDPDYCATCDEPDRGAYPTFPPPCVMETCSIRPLPLDETRGRQGSEVRTRGGSRQIQLDATCGDPEDCGVLACYTDPEGGFQGLDVALYGDPERIDGIDCTDPDTGADLYINPIRRFTNPDGSCSQGALPFPVSDTVCEPVDGCDGYYPPPGSLTSDVWTNCGPSICAEIKNMGCYPMLVRPTLEIFGSEIEGPAQIEYQPNDVGGEGFGEKFATARGVWIACEETSTAGSGETSASGDAATSAGGGDSHTHDGPSHTHGGPSHTHDVDCVVKGGGVFSGVVPFDPVEIASGETYQFCVEGSVRFLEPDWPTGGVVNYGQVRLCLSGASIVNADTVGAFEGAV